MQQKSKLRIFFEKYFYTAFGALHLLTFGILKDSNRTRLATIAEEFGWQNPKKSNPTIIPQLDLKQSFREGLEVVVCDPIAKPGNVSLLELVVLNSLVRMTKPMALFEIGTYDGRTTLNLAANAPTGAQIFTLDLPEEKFAETKKNPQADSRFVARGIKGSRYHGTQFERRISELKGDSLEFDFSPYKKKMDFVFIDGGHTYPFVSSDTKHALAMIRDGGIIAWHDYKNTSPGVTKTINDLYAQGGVFKNLRWVKDTMLVILAPESVLARLQS